MRLFKVLAAFVFLALALCAIDLFYLVDQGGQAVITQLGQPVGGPAGPGLHVKLPFIQQATFFEKRVLGWKSGPMEMTTKDSMPVVVELTARWRITRPVAFLRTLGTYEQAYAKLDGVIPSAMESHVAQNSLAGLVRTSAALKTIDQGQGDAAPAPMAVDTGPIRLGRDALMRAVRADAAQGLDGLGIELADVGITRLSFGQKVEGLVYQRMIAERKARAEGLRSEGEGKRAEIAGLMEKELQGLRSEAFRISEEIRGKADAEAAGIYAKAYSRDPEFYSFMNTLETYRNTPFDNTTFILGADSDFYKVLKGPSK